MSRLATAVSPLVHESIMGEITSWPEAVLDGNDPRLDVFIPRHHLSDDICADFIIAACVHLTPSETRPDFETWSEKVWTHAAVFAEQSENVQLSGRERSKESEDEAAKRRLPLAPLLPRLVCIEPVQEITVEEFMAQHEAFAAVERMRSNATSQSKPEAPTNGATETDYRRLKLLTTVTMFPSPELATRHIATHQTSSLWRVDGRSLLKSLRKICHPMEQ